MFCRGFLVTVLPTLNVIRSLLRRPAPSRQRDCSWVGRGRQPSLVAMPPGKEPTAAKQKKPSAEEETLKKAALQHAMQVKKDNRKLKPKAFVKKFDEELSKVTILCVHS